MKLAFIVDPVAGLAAYKDSSVAMMRAAARRGIEVWAIERAHLAWQDGVTTAQARHITPLEPSVTGSPWYVAGEKRRCALTEFAAVLMRQDPPFDAEYLAATWLLERAEAEGARIFNRPGAIRSHSEKIAIAEFPQFAPPTLIARDMGQVQAFIDHHGEVILKPLDGMGGASIFRVHSRDPNRNVIVETLTQEGARTIMAQRYLPQIVDGDKRIVLIAGKPLPYALARIPKAGETRGNLAAGGTGRAQALSARDLDIAQTLGPLLWARGLFLVGLDVIGEHLTEINVTSPTCLVEIEQQTGVAGAALAIDELLALVQ